MLVVLTCLDKAEHLETRMANREAHLAYAKASAALVSGGPFLDGDGKMYGSMVVLDVESLAEAEAWAANDPYAKAGLFQSVEIRQWKKVLGA